MHCLTLVWNVNSRLWEDFCWLLHWSQYCDMPSIKEKPGASTDLGIYNAWRSDMWVYMICWDTNDADWCRACMRASVLTVCTPFSIQNITLWSTCGSPASPTSSSSSLTTHGSFFACLIASTWCTSMVLFLCWMFSICSCLSLLVRVYVATFNEIKQTISQLSG